MLGERRCLIVLPTLLAMSIACNTVHTATELQELRLDNMQQRFGTHFTYMADNAMLHDMSLADIHFVPHTSELSGVGEARLERLAKLLNVYGGTVRYETQLDDEAQSRQRLEHVREYLALIGCNMDRVEVAIMMSGGRGMPGEEAVWKYRTTTAQPKEAQPVSPLSNAINIGGG